MAVISLAKDLQQPIHQALTQLPVVEIRNLDLKDFKEKIIELGEEFREALYHLSVVCKSLIKEHGFVVIKNLSQTPDARALVAIATEIGHIFQDTSHQSTTVVEASPNISPKLQGNQTEPLFMHTDFAMLENPPAVTMILCQRPDPIPGFGQNGITLAQNIVSRIFGSQLLDDLFSVSLPFGGRKPDGSDVVFMAPILSSPIVNSQLSKVRFHPSRIHHGFRLRGGPPGKTETYLLRKFQTLAIKNRSEVGLDQGDLLLLNNRCVLHDRTRCSLELGRNTFLSRLVQIIFVQDIIDTKD